jgi:hypothetical protein
MRGRLSLWAVVITASVLSWTRFEYSEVRGWSPMKVTQWDALAYYSYLPAAFIYHDLERMAWVEPIDSTYHVVGTGGLYQLENCGKGHRVNKYLIGTALMELPFFFIGHTTAGLLDFPQDGFSPPYQWAVAFSPLFYCILAVFLLRRVLCRWFTDHTVALVIPLLVLGTNAIQYISVDNAQTHGFLFALYVLALWATIQWHEAPRLKWALVLAGTMTLAIFTRPTELIIVFLPLLWNTHSPAAAKAKWTLVRMHGSHFIWMAGIAVLIAFPQLLYWKFVTGSWVYGLGSKWDFLDPHWRVLVGWEKGWFIYTPITLLFVAGLFFMRGKPWRKSVLVFSLLNVWIIIAWHDWRYGGSYSARALVQSYPVWALAFAALVERALATRWRWPFILVCGYLLFVNLFQIMQYNNQIILYDGMTRERYGSVYLELP